MEVNGREIIDSTESFAALERAAGAMQRGIEAAAQFQWQGPQQLASVVVAGEGEMAVAGRVLAAVAAGSTPIPVVVAPSATPPAFVGPHTLVFLDAQTPPDQRKRYEERGCPIVATGVPDQIRPFHVTSIAATLVTICARIGVIPGADAELKEAVRLVDERIVKLRPGGAETDDNPALKIATILHRRIPLVYGETGAAAAAAEEWKRQLNLRAKMPAFWTPDAAVSDHEIAGWGQHGDVTRQLIGIVRLRNENEPTHVETRHDAVGELIEEAIALIYDVRTTAITPLGTFCDLAILGDYVALYCAALAEVDPGPVEVADRLASMAPTPEVSETPAAPETEDQTAGDPEATTV